jgi:hypothetical protein
MIFYESVQNFYNKNCKFILKSEDPVSIRRTNGTIEKNWKITSVEFRKSKEKIVFSVVKEVKFDNSNEIIVSTKKYHQKHYSIIILIYQLKLMLLQKLK